MKFKCFVWIVECDAAQNCSGQGICGPDGACQCEATFYGDNCTSKLFNHQNIFWNLNALFE